MFEKEDIQKKSRMENLKIGISIPEIDDILILEEKRRRKLIREIIEGKFQL